MKKNIFLILMLPFFSWGQNISIDPRNFNSGNIELTRAVNENRNIKGHPYLEEDFSISTIEFKDGTTYEGLIRFNIGKDVFEMKSNTSEEIYEFKLKLGVLITHYNRTFEAKLLSSEKSIATFEILVNDTPYSLYKYHKKIIKEPRKDGIAMPSSNQGNNSDAFWSDQSSLVLMANNQVYELEKSHKKLLKSGMVDPTKYNQITKKKKYKLDKIQDVINLVKALNQ
ncbi:hypothetical protein N9H42_06890 [Flavobacteriaceae bacterium]|jgi:hypothetical protein|nr:hypothetical protein [Flavobacteriaceae bacterium]MDC1364370.1 hypothetical protein [Flavobacteriaceae bacterium]